MNKRIFCNSNRVSQFRFSFMEFSKVLFVVNTVDKTALLASGS